MKKAKHLGINISAVAEMGIIDYIKELESIGRESNNSKDCLNQYNEKNEITKPIEKVSMDLSESTLFNRRDSQQEVPIFAALVF